MSGRTEPLLIVGPAPIKRMLDAICEASDLRLTYPLLFKEVEEASGDLMAQDAAEFSVTSTGLSHRAPCFAYAFSEKQIERRLDTGKLKRNGVPAGPLWGQLQSGMDLVLADGSALKSCDFLLPARRSRKIVVAGDNDTPGLLREACADADVLVHESTYTMEVAQKVGPAPQHCAAQTIAAFAQECGLSNLVLTHFSARYQDDVSRSPSIQDIRTEAEAYYNGRLFLAKDFDLFALNREGVLTGHTG